MHETQSGNKTEKKLYLKKITKDDVLCVKCLFGIIK